VGFFTDDIQNSRLSLGEGRAGKAAAENKVLIFPDLSQQQDKFTRETLLTNEKIVSHHIAPLIAKGKIIGVLRFSAGKSSIRMKNGWNYLDSGHSVSHRSGWSESFHRTTKE
jgi:putative methionine-R-sulfoxide reductase with GAF domain